MAQRPAQPTTIGRGRSWQGQDYTALRHRQQAEEADSREGCSIVLLLSGH
jgi:hypothetical protein